MKRHFPLNPATGLEDAALLPWTNGNPSNGTEGSYPPFGLFTDPQDSFLAMQAVAGLTDANDVTQAAQALARGVYLGTFGGSTNGLTASLPGAIVFPSVLPGLRFTGIAAFNNTAGVSLTLSGLTSTPVTAQVLRRDGTALQPGDLIAGLPFTLVVDNAGAFRLSSIGLSEVPRIVANPTLYVRTDGNDNNDGSANTADKAYATLAGATTKGASRFFLGGSTLTVQLGVPGTYAAPGNIAVGASVLIQGDIANKAGYIISGAGVGSGSGVTVASTGLVSFKGVAFQNTGSTNWTLAAIGNASIAISDCAFAITVGGNSYAHLLASGGGQISVGAGCTFSGSANSLWLAAGGTIVVNGVPVAITGTPFFPASTVKATDGGKVQFGPGSSFAGMATGPRYSVLVNAIINTLGGGENFIPGNSGGNVLNGGQYV